MWIILQIPAKTGKSGKVVCVWFSAPLVSGGNYAAPDQCNNAKRAWRRKEPEPYTSKFHHHAKAKRDHSHPGYHG